MDALVSRLELRAFALVGFSMGGGEVARYLGKYRADRVRAAVFISSIPPYLLKACDNPEGVDGSVFDGIKAAAAKDRPAFFSSFFENFYNVDVLKGTRISDPQIQASWNVAIESSAIASVACVDTWGTDFRADLAKITCPTLMIHGDADRIVPLPAAGQRTHETIPSSKLVVVEGGPHGILLTHPDIVNPALLHFLK